MSVVARVGIEVDNTRALRATRQLDGAAQKLRKSFLSIGKVLVGAEITRRFFQGFTEAENAAAAVRTLGVDSKRLKAELLGVSAELRGLKSQTELTAAAYDVASAGFTDASDAAKILKASSLGAVGGLSDLATVADAATSVLNAYGISARNADKIIDGFIQTQNDGKIIVAQYASQIGRIAPIAAAAGVGVDELNAAISAVTATGVPVESTFSGLRQAIASVIKPTKEAQDAAKLLGLQFDSAAIKSKGFGGFLTDVIQKTGGSEVALTRLFGSVEAVATILPLANDDLKKFNKSLDNQRKSAGAAEKAAKVLGGTVSQQTTSIVNNIGNIARVLDERLGPVLNGILTQINNIITAATTALAKFSDVVTGDVSRSAASLQALTSTGFASESAFVGLKESVQRLRPNVASSTQELLKIEGALDEAGRAALRFSGKGAFGRLRNDVLDAITAMRRLVIARREALESKPTGTGAPTIDPRIKALQDQIRALLAGQDVQGKGGGTKKTGPTEAERAVAAARENLQSLRDQVELGATRTQQERDMVALNQAIRDINADRAVIGNELADKQIQALRSLFTINQVNDAIAQQDKDRLEAQRRLTSEQEKQKQQVAAIGSAVKNSITNTILDAVNGTKSLSESLSGVLRQLASFAINFGIGSIGKGLKIPGFANGGRPPVGRPSIVGERGPELFIPRTSGTIVPNSSLGGNVNIVVNVTEGQTDTRGGGGQANQLGNAIAAAVQSELIKQKRPGGLLAS